MRRDMDIVRDLLKLSATTSAPRVDAYSLASPSRSRELIAYHVRIVTQAGLVDSYAGMIPRAWGASSFATRVPRIHGDDPYDRERNRADLSCSPHTRG